VTWNTTSASGSSARTRTQPACDAKRRLRRTEGSAADACESRPVVGALEGRSGRWKVGMCTHRSRLRCRCNLGCEVVCGVRGGTILVTPNLDTCLLVTPNLDALCLRLPTLIHVFWSHTGLDARLLRCPWQINALGPLEPACRYSCGSTLGKTLLHVLTAVRVLCVIEGKFILHVYRDRNDCSLCNVKRKGLSYLQRQRVKLRCDRR
jgi:hypothetical protein